jgi:hypothetical protein
VTLKQTRAALIVAVALLLFTAMIAAHSRAQYVGARQRVQGTEAELAIVKGRALECRRQVTELQQLAQAEQVYQSQQAQEAEPGGITPDHAAQLAAAVLKLLL